MSLPYILSTARKLGIPVVITNDRGESAQVVMPFEDFASMVNGSQSHGHARCEDCHCGEEDEETLPLADEIEDWTGEESEEGSYELTPEEIEELDKIIIEDEQITTEPAVQPKEIKESKEPKEAVEPTSVSLEDQFYFEPIQEKE